MGTVKNGVKWSGACVNGKNVGGLVKNGVAFFKKTTQSFKRRIMVGDNLTNKTVYFDFPDNFHESITSRIGMNSWVYTIMAMQTYSHIREGNQSGGQLVVISPELYDENVYYYSYNNVLETNEAFASAGNFGVVTSISDTPCYRHCWIEDSNIRALQVGDVIKQGTKLYFTFPDEFGNDLATYSGQTLVSTNSTVDFGTLKFLTHLGAGITRAADPYYDYLYVTDSINSSDENRIAIMAFEKIMTNSLEKNLSVYVFTSNNMATVTSIMSQFNEYVLVDTTTLG